MTEPEDGAPAREVVEIGRQPRGEDRWPVARAEDDRAEANPRGLNGERAKMQPDFRRVGRMVAEEERVEPERVGEAPGGHHPRRGIGVVRQGERLKPPADAMAELAHPRMTAVFESWNPPARVRS